VNSPPLESPAKTLETLKYGFYQRLRAEFPSQVIIDTTEICNLACVHCPHPTFKKSEHYSGACLDPALNAKAIDEVRAHGRSYTQYVRYTGEGETLLHKGFFEMLSYATANAGVAVTVTTNGVLLDEARIERLLSCGPHLVDISIDAHSPEVYSSIRVRGDLRRTRSNVLNLLRRRSRSNSRTKVVVSFIEQPQNLHETREFERFWKENGADCVAVRRLHSAAGELHLVAAALNEGGQQLPRRPCVYPWERVVLNPRGHLSFCPADWAHRSTVSDYRRTTIKETWRSEFYQQLRQAHLGGDFSRHAFCAQCPDWKITVWPQRGRGYADMVEDFKARE